MPGTFVFCDPSFPPSTNYQAIFYDQTSGANAGTITGTKSSILGGDPSAPTNNINGDFSTILMGDVNTINTFSGAVLGSFNTIVNGQSNTIGSNGVFPGPPLPVSFSSILGGANNCIDTTDIVATQYGTITGGNSNCILPGADCSFIGGGGGNKVFGISSSVVAGDVNFIYAASNCSSIGGGQGNRIGGTAPFSDPAVFSFVVGGADNVIDTSPGAGSSYNSIGGGHQSLISAGTACSSIFGGAHHTVMASGSFVGAGEANSILASSDYSFIGGGGANAIANGGANSLPAIFGVIAGGNRNCIDTGAVPGSGSSYGVIGGGQSNTVCAGTAFGAIFSGFNHIVAGNNSFIGGGDTNTINILSDCSFVIGGNGNNIGLVGGGGLGATFSAIGGGQNNNIDDTAFASSFSGIFSGANHVVTGNNSFVGGGNTNIIASVLGPVNCSVIAGGQNNAISDDGGALTSDLSFIGSGFQNTIQSVRSAIGGGCQNCIVGNFATAHGVQAESFIGAGSNNQIFGYYSFIGGGNSNIIQSTAAGTISHGAAIGGGVGNSIRDNGVVEAYNSVIAGGGGNSIFGIYSAITGGMGNTVHSVYSFIGGGSSNYVNLLSDCSAISSGFSNRVGITGGGGNGATFSFIGGGCENIIVDNTVATSYGVISGGQGNQICEGTHHSSIFGGIANKLTASCSAIVGGSGNCDNGFPFTGIYGNGIVASAGIGATGAPSNFWVDELIVANIVVDTTGALWAGLPAGALYTTVAGPSFWGGRPVFVK